MNQMDEIEVTFTEVLNLFYRKKVQILGIVFLGTLLSSIIAYILITPTYQMKLIYSITPTSGEDISLLFHEMLNQERSESLAKSMELPISSFHGQGGRPFSLEKKRYKAHDKSTNLYSSMEVTFDVKTRALAEKKLLKNFNTHILKPSVVAFLQRSQLYNFITQSEIRKDFLMRSILEISDSVTYDRLVLQSLKSSGQRDRGPKPNIDLSISPPIQLTVQKSDMETKTERSIPSDFTARHFLPIQQQIFIVEGVLRDKVLKKNYFLDEIKAINRSTEKAQAAIDSVPFKTNELDTYFNNPEDLKYKTIENLKFMFKDKVMSAENYSFLLTPEAKATVRKGRSITILISGVTISVLLAILIALLTDFWTNNKEAITKIN